ncbi:hypothetical protein Glove_87g70 [Diversispora epigaea]|uniref:Uncharacterized protein n=1 Tax=Diversispora epigaea TaxID=1348612 RepID=A0A397J5Z9_9GLOM|nr:hypothetical protein Glove_87g70 [Diversispora epigaea]
MNEQKQRLRDLTPEYLKWQAKITIIPDLNYRSLVEINELREENAKLKHDKEEVKEYNLKQELGELNSKKNRKFQENIRVDAFFQKYRIALEVHQFYAISWCKDVKKLEDKKRHIPQHEIC